MTETIVLPSDKTAGAITGGEHNEKGLYDLITYTGLENANRASLHAIHETTAIGRENTLRSEAATLAIVKDSLFQTSQMVNDVKNHVTAEASALRTMFLETSHRQELAARDAEARSVRTALQDAKDEISALKIKANATVAI